MKNTPNIRLIQEEINRTKLLSGYNVALTLNEQQLGDANSDGIVDQLDTDWGTSNWLQPGDVHDSNDNIVNLADLSLVTNNYGQGDESSSLFSAGYANTTSAVDAVQFKMHDGNIDAGDICLYGIL